MADFGGNMALNIEQRLGQKITNEKQILWDYLLTRWPNLTFQPLFYQGAIVGSEFLTYSANKLYFTYSCTFNGGSAAALPGNIILYNEVNSGFYVDGNNSVYWDVTAAALRYVPNNVYDFNIYFSRISLSGYVYMSFNGYRLTI